ncbi:MAG: hypothetical protein ACRD1T_03265 [Acidimicrobiia bacterium]
MRPVGTRGPERKDVGRMQEILARMVDVVATNPGAAVGIVGALLFGAMAWGVISSSYRYR